MIKFAMRCFSFHKMNKKYLVVSEKQNQIECNASYILPSPLGLAPAPADPMASYSPPQLMGGHMLPGPTPDPYEMTYSEPRYCPEPCPQECAPGCYDWCCYPSIQVPPPPMQLMMVPVNVSSKPSAAPVPAPLPYPMTYGVNDACSPNPCPAKKHDVIRNSSLSLFASRYNNAAVTLSNNLVSNKTTPDIQTSSVAKATTHQVSEEIKQQVKETSKIVEDKSKQVKPESVKVASEVASSSKKSVSSSTVVESKGKKNEHHVSKFVKNDVDPEMIEDEDDAL